MHNDSRIKIEWSCLTTEVFSSMASLYTANRAFLPRKDFAEINGTPRHRRKANGWSAQSLTRLTRSSVNSRHRASVARFHKATLIDRYEAVE